MRHPPGEMGTGIPRNQTNTLNLAPTCLKFRYDARPSRFASTSKDVGTQILNHVAAEFRRHNYDVSEPHPLKKGVVIGATCKVGDDSLGLSVVPPKEKGNDEWVLLTFRHRGNRHLPEQYLIEWNEIQELLIDALSSAEGVTVLGWVSYQEAIGPVSY